MNYSSTRGKDNDISFVQAMLNGLAKDGGLYVPKGIKKLTNSELMELSELSYQKLAFEITKLFVGIDEINQKDFKKFVKKLTAQTLVNKLSL